MNTHVEIYDKRYAGDYRDKLNPFEKARIRALSHFIPSALGETSKITSIVDYGAGTGMFANLWFELFPDGHVRFCDISSVAQEKFGLKFPERKDDFQLISEGRANFPDGSFDLVISIEVMEHVEDVGAYLDDINRLLTPGGSFIWTTPCSNSFSIEHLWAKLSGQIVPTDDGRLFKWDDPTHLRRMNTSEIGQILPTCGFELNRLRMHRHFFSYLCQYVLPGRYRFRNFYSKVMELDYRLFRCLPNGGSMIGLATKTRDSTDVAPGDESP